LKKRVAIALVIMTVLILGYAPLRAQEKAAKPADPAPSSKASKAKDEGQNIDELKKDAPRVFLDGEKLDMNFIKTEIQFVNYVRDRKEADVHVLVTQLGTGSGGREYTLAFIGLGKYEDLRNELKYYSNRVDTNDESRQGLVQMLKLGLAPYAARTPIAGVLNLNFVGLVKQTSVTDKWNFWVFSLSVNTRLNGEKSRKSNALFGNVSVNRTTPESKLRLGLSANQDKTQYDYEDYQGTSSSNSRSFDGLYVFSLGEHWSVGGFINLNHSTYSNINFGLTFAPAIEYNFFPYSQSTRRQFRVLYRIGYNWDKYIEQTIYSRMEDKTWSQSLNSNSPGATPKYRSNARTSSSAPRTTLPRESNSFRPGIFTAFASREISRSGSLKVYRSRPKAVTVGFTTSSPFAPGKPTSPSFSSGERSLLRITPINSGSA